MAILAGRPRVNEGQRHERPRIFGPARDHRQAIEADVRRDDVEDRAGRYLPIPDLAQIEGDVTRGPQLRRRQRHDRFREMHDTLDERLRPRAERQLRSTRGAEQVGDERKVRVLDVGEQQGRTAGGNHAAMNLRRFELRINGRGDLDEIAILSQAIDEGTQIRKHQ
jgi:hypothetical protein